MGSTYSKYHTDPWHWGSVASDAINYINGYELFKDIVLLWGPGQAILYDAINNFYNINYYSVGIVTSLVFSLNLLLSYAILRKLSDSIIAITLSFTIFCLVPYPQVPWPDFYSGFCITISCFFLITSNKNIPLFISAFFLIASIVFRNSYIMGVIPAIIAYYFLFVFQQKKIPLFLKKISIFFILIFITCIVYALVKNNLLLWHDQGLGRIGEYQYQNNKIFGISINSFVFFLIKFLYHIFFPARIENYYFLIIFIFNLGVIFAFLFRKKFFEVVAEENDKIIFFLMLGIFGILQSSNQYEIWRHVNSSISIFFVLAYFFKKFLHNHYKAVLCVIILLSLVPLFPFSDKKNGAKHFSGTNYFPLKGYFINNKFVDGKYLYFKSDIVFFGNHQFNSENLIYYKKVKSLVCGYEKIINYSVDRTLAYICDRKNLIVSTYPRNNGRPTFYKPEIELKYTEGYIDENEIIIADKRFANNNLRLINKIKIPKYTRYTYSDLSMRYFDNYIYFYVKK